MQSSLLRSVRPFGAFRSVVIRNMSAAAFDEAGPIEQGIKAKIVDNFKPTHLVIDNDSWKHSGHHGLRGASNTTESHFRMVIVSSEFTGKSQPIRHRMVYKVLDDEMKTKGLHALQLKTKTPEEWEKTQK